MHSFVQKKNDLKAHKIIQTKVTTKSAGNYSELCINILPMTGRRLVQIERCRKLLLSLVAYKDEVMLQRTYNNYLKFYDILEEWEWIWVVVIVVDSEKWSLVDAYQSQKCWLMFYVLLFIFIFKIE